MSLIGNFPELITIDNWIIFSERLDAYFALNNIVGDKRKSILITTMTEAIYKVLRNACDPVSPNSLTYEELVNKMHNEYLKSKAVSSCAYDKRVKYYTAKQEDSESVHDWKIRIKNMFTECQFSWKSEHELNEKFISGLYSTDVLRKVCEEINELNFQSAAETAKTMENSLKGQATKVDGKY